MWHSTWHAGLTDVIANLVVRNSSAGPDKSCHPQIIQQILEMEMGLPFFIQGTQCIGSFETEQNNGLKKELKSFTLGAA
jgi:hypothetical protein